MDASRPRSWPPTKQPTDAGGSLTRFLVGKTHKGEGLAIDRGGSYELPPRSSFYLYFE